MLSQKLLEIIDRSIIGKYVSKKRDLIEKTNPEKIYIENVRSFFNTSFGVAKFLCDKATEFGFFKKYYGFLCPIHNNIIYSSQSEFPNANEIVCHICEDLGENKYQYASNELKKIIFYRLVKKEESYVAG